MEKSSSELAEAIVSKSIGRQEALNRFETLTAAQKEEVMTALRSRLVARSHKDEPSPQKAQRLRLRVRDERNLGEAQVAFLQELIRQYGERVPRSRHNAMTEHRCLVDARKVSNLKKSMKALQFHLSWDGAEGANLYDIDGNEYVDITGDHGCNIFGSQPEFIKTAIAERLHKGYPLLGYTDEIFEASRLFCELTGHERVAFTQSGTEAVVLAVRIARAATQRSKIVIFEGAFHGLSDTVAAVKDFAGNSLSAGLGIPQAYADELIVLDYGNPDHLSVIERRAGEIGGVLVEPVQSGQPHIQPVEFLHQLRRLTLEHDIPLIFDEMITGFRVCPRGAQGYFNVKADLATYGKIPGGGMPTGMVAGAAKYMDFIDGGEYGLDDESMPKMRRVYIGGTHTRNPLKVSASLAVLREIKARACGAGDCSKCSCFQRDLNERTRQMASELNEYLLARSIPMIVDHFSSLFRFRLLEQPFGVTRELLLVLLRMNGVEPSFSGNFFLTTAHTEHHVATVVRAFKAAVDTLLEAGFFYPAAVEESESAAQERPVASVPRLAAVSPGTAHRPGSRELEKLKELLRADLASVRKGGVL
jgi:glutamate-1-semialdehyde aminotransferase